MVAQRWQDWLILLLGGALAASPWVLGFSDYYLAAVVVGGLLVVAAIWALSMPDTELAEWFAVLLGAVVFLSPWLLGFTHIATAAWTAWMIGALIVTLSTWTLLWSEDSPSRMQRS